MLWGPQPLSKFSILSKPFWVFPWIYLQLLLFYVILLDDHIPSPALNQHLGAVDSQACNCSSNSAMLETVMSYRLWTKYFASTTELTIFLPKLTSSLFCLFLQMIWPWVSSQNRKTSVILDSSSQLMPFVLVSSLVSPDSSLSPRMHPQALVICSSDNRFLFDLHASTLFFLSIHSASCVHQGNLCKANLILSIINYAFE